MKKLLFLIAIIAIAKFVKADPAKIQYSEAGTTVAVSSTTWTAVPSTTTVDTSRIGIIFDSANASLGFRIILSSAADPAPTNAVTDGYAYDGSESMSDLSISGFVYMFAISTDTANATQNMWVQEYRDKR
jgi:hypothetical protein